MAKPHETVPLHFTLVPPDTMQERADAFLALMAQRRSVRDFAPRPVPRQLIETAIMTAASAPSGANQQPWTFVAINDADAKRAIRLAAEEEERAFYAGRAPEEWLDALATLGTDWQKPFLETAPWLIAIFGQRWGNGPDGEKISHYYVPETVGIATGLLIAALHNAGLSTLTHTPSPMKFLNQLCGRPDNEKPMILMVVGYPAENCRVPAIQRKTAGEVMRWIEST
jgi:iodotyrosine deiodinase